MYPLTPEQQKQLDELRVRLDAWYCREAAKPAMSEDNATIAFHLFDRSYDDQDRPVMSIAVRQETVETV